MLPVFVTHAATVEEIARCFAPFAGQNPVDVFQEEGLFFDGKVFASCRDEFLEEWDEDPSLIQKVPLSLAVAGLRGIIVSAGMDQSVLGKLHGFRFHEKMRAFLQHVERNARFAMEKSYPLQLQKNAEEEDFFILIDEILSGAHFVEVTISVLRADQEDKQVKQIMAQAKRIQEKVFVPLMIIAKKHYTFTDKGMQLWMELQGSESKFDPNQGAYRFVGSLIQQVWADFSDKDGFFIIPI